ncbi:ABC transporter ATP-binding protein [Botrimarina hoheduenensis]|uniref:Putative ABC transporter ATP-binding protein n=1 Tax=Botrimarina hoheduenensis TaxID=2528000 RepID=A0A5C5WBR3_9BACT|nr:ATP-binding cassette domain-containing protein [Botrimarina hoheduenensis]TWT48346.1 putative ABC transporter ATP-binding protein [Botrimarina hoheduenensis]
MSASTPPSAPDPAVVSSMLDVRRVSVRFGEQAVLRDLTLSVPRGETLVIIGESGCGKTVLLKSLIGLVKPTQGVVSFCGRPLAGLTDRELTAARTRYGFVFQNAALFDSLSVAENVAFPLIEHRRATREAAYQAAIERLHEVGLPTSVMTKKPAQLSGGMRKRVGLARALVMEPEVLLYDEPTTGLDPIMSDVINELILRTREGRKGVTSVVVTHDMHSARKLADRIIMLYPVSRLLRGEPQIVYDGPPEGIDASNDQRVTQFVRGEARDRLEELSLSVAAD